MKKLATEKQEKEDFQKRLEEEKRAFEDKLNRMRQRHEEQEEENKTLSKKFSDSLSLLS